MRRKKSIQNVGIFLYDRKLNESEDPDPYQNETYPQHCTGLNV